MWQKSEAALHDLKWTVVHSSYSVVNYSLIFIQVYLCEHQYTKICVNFLGIVAVNFSTHDSCLLALCVLPSHPPHSPPPPPPCSIAAANNMPHCFSLLPAKSAGWILIKQAHSIQVPSYSSMSCEDRSYHF